MAATKTATKTVTEYPEVEVITERPVEERKPLKLSEALRLGAMGTKQAYGHWHKTSPKGEDMMCALSTAWYALTGEKDNDAQGSPLHSLLEGVRVEHPVHGGNVSLANAIIDLNDSQKWGRDKIADWLESKGL